jgi:hypothetical protein
MRREIGMTSGSENQPPLEELDECALLSEESLARDWNRPEEDAAWAHLQADPSITAEPSDKP